MYATLKRFGLLFLILALFAEVSLAARVERVAISGNKRIPDDRITPYLIKTGSEFNPDEVAKTIEQLHKTGYFIEVSIDAAVVNNRFTVTYIVREMPLIADIRLTGSKKYSQDKLLETVTVKKGEPLNLLLLGSSIKALQDIYEKDEYYNVKITHELEYTSVTSVNIVFDVVEGKRARIYNIWFYGNENYSTEKLKEQMMTKEKDFWSIMNSSGMLMKDITEIDRERVRQFYMSEGYANVDVGEAHVEFQPDRPDRMNYLIRVREGIRYKVSLVDYSDTLKLFERDDYDNATKLRTGDYFNITQFRRDMASIVDMYSDIGYAKANVVPDVRFNDQAQTVDILLNVEEGPLVSINRIEFTGNEKTRDNVLRREFDIYEGDLYSGKLLREAQRNVMANGFYEDIRLAERSVDETHTDINANVKEAQDGSISVTAAYSTQESWIGRMEFSQANLFGYGTSLKLYAEYTSYTKRRDYQVSYTDPWVFNRPYSAGIDLYSREVSYTEYVRRANGVALRLGHQPIKRRLFMNYAFAYDNVNIYNIADNVTHYISDQKGITETISFTPSITYANLNNNIDPSDGFKATARLKYAGIFDMGDADYLKGILEMSYYHPLPARFVFTLHGEGGQLWNIAQSGGNHPIPIDERFYLGGMYSVRGFQTREISPKDSNGYVYGGNKYYQGNIELWRPVFEENISIRLVGFFDMGQVFDDGISFGSTKPRMSAGGGIRMFTPVGLLRFEIGYKLDRKKDEERSRIEFSIGSKF
ncbi:outer membrane protein assembly factor BamA [Deferribacterales bacterium]|nr:outer membrane protein assembly factor BamA [Deferribacterales bacterium]